MRRAADSRASLGERRSPRLPRRHRRRRARRPDALAPRRGGRRSLRGESGHRDRGRGRAQLPERGRRDGAVGGRPGPARLLHEPRVEEAIAARATPSASRCRPGVKSRRARGSSGTGSSRAPVRSFRSSAMAECSGARHLVNNLLVLPDNPSNLIPGARGSRVAFGKLTNLPAGHRLGWEGQGRDDVRTLQRGLR